MKIGRQENIIVKFWKNNNVAFRCCAWYYIHVVKITFVVCCTLTT